MGLAVLMDDNGVGVCEISLYFPHSFALNLKLLYKSFKKRQRENLQNKRYFRNLSTNIRPC